MQRTNKILFSLCISYSSSNTFAVGIAEFNQTFRQWSKNRTNIELEDRLATQYTLLSSNGKASAEITIKSRGLGGARRFIRGLVRDVTRENARIRAAAAPQMPLAPPPAPIIITSQALLDFDTQLANYKKQLQDGTLVDTTRPSVVQAYSKLSAAEQNTLPKIDELHAQLITAFEEFKNTTPHVISEKTVQAIIMTYDGLPIIEQQALTNIRSGFTLNKQPMLIPVFVERLKQKHPFIAQRAAEMLKKQAEEDAKFEADKAAKLVEVPSAAVGAVAAPSVISKSLPPAAAASASSAVPAPRTRESAMEESIKQLKALLPNIITIDLDVLVPEGDLPFEPEATALFARFSAIMMQIYKDNQSFGGGYAENLNQKLFEAIISETPLFNRLESQFYTTTLGIRRPDIPRAQDFKNKLYSLARNVESQEIKITSAILQDFSTPLITALLLKFIERSVPSYLQTIAKGLVLGT